MKLVLIFIFISSAIAQDGEELVQEYFDLDNLRPTQMQVGAQVTSEMEKKLYQKFLIAKGYDEKTGMKNLVAYFEFVREYYKTNPVPGVVESFSGKRVAHITDGHHRSHTLVQVINRLEKAPTPEDYQKAAEYLQSNPFKMNVEVIKDMSKLGWTEEDFYKYLLTAKVVNGERGIAKGQFDYYVRTIMDREKVPFEKRATYFPKTIFELEDDPYRSLVGSVFYDSGMVSDDMADYIEFHIAESMRIHGYTMPSVIYTEEDLLRATHFLFSNNDSYSYLLTKAIDLNKTSKEMVQARIRVAKIAFYKKHGEKFKINLIGRKDRELYRIYEQLKYLVCH